MTADSNPYQALDRYLVRRGGLAEDVAGYVRELVLTGVLKPGEKIDQDAIGVALDVSRSPIREALVVLGKEGLLDVTPRRGAFVANLTRADIIDHYELFGLVSGRVAALAATTLSDDDIGALQEVHQRFVDSPASEHSKLNHEFHSLINSVAPRRTRWLLQHLERSVPSNYYDFVIDWDDTAMAGHAQIVEAIAARDAQRAREAMEAHLHEGGVAAADALLSRGFWKDTV